MNFLQNREVCFNQESLPITYHNFHHKSLVDPKVNHQIDKAKVQGQFFPERMHVPNICQIQYDL